VKRIEARRLSFKGGIHAIEHEMWAGMGGYVKIAGRTSAPQLKHQAGEDPGNLSE